MSIIDGDVSDKILSCDVVVVNALLELLRQSKIAFQPKTKGEWAMIDNTRESEVVLTCQVSSDCPLNVATKSAGCRGDKACERAMRIKTKWQIKCHTLSIWSSTQYSPVGRSVRCTGDRAYQREHENWNPISKRMPYSIKLVSNPMESGMKLSLFL